MLYTPMATVKKFGGRSSPPGLVCRITAEADHALDLLAASRGVTRSEIVRQMVDAELRRAAAAGELPKEVLSKAS